jgi:hypothetical protein
MTPTLIILGCVLLFGGGAAVGVAVTKDKAAEVVEHQTELIAELQDGQRALVEAAGRPVVIDAEVRASLSEVPPACIESLGGSPLSPVCSMQLCWSYGQSAAQRPPCQDVTEAAIELFQKGMSDSATP